MPTYILYVPGALQMTVFGYKGFFWSYRNVGEKGYERNTGKLKLQQKIGKTWFCSKHLKKYNEKVAAGGMS